MGHATKWKLGDIHKVCSWCDATMHEGHPDCPVTTHGICRSCEVKLAAPSSPPKTAPICRMCSEEIETGAFACDDCIELYGLTPILNPGLFNDA